MSKRAARESLEQIVSRVLCAELDARGIVRADTQSLAAEKGDECRDDETKKPESSGRTGSKAKGTGKRRFSTREQRIQDVDALIDTLATSKKRTTG